MKNPETGQYLFTKINFLNKIIQLPQESPGGIRTLKTLIACNYTFKGVFNSLFSNMALFYFWRLVRENNHFTLINFVK